MKTLEYISLNIILFLLANNTYSQSFSLDTTFHPNDYFNSIYISQNPVVYNIAEYNAEKVFINGDMGYNDIQDLIFINEDGSWDTNFYLMNSLYGGSLFIFKVSGDTLIFGRWGLSKVDLNGNYLNLDWIYNMREDIYRYWWNDLCLLENGSVIAVDRTVLYSDETRYDLVRFNPDGHLDSTCILDPVFGNNEYLASIFQYDEDRFIVTGGFAKWFDYPILNVCRFYIETGEIDTTFHSVFSWYYPSRLEVLPDGKMLVAGIFKFVGDPKHYCMARLNTDGSIDTTFNTTVMQYLPGQQSVKAVCATPDGGYLIGGCFDEYQGYLCNNLAKIDADGNYDTTIRFDLLCDSTGHSDDGVRVIVPGQNNKYYVGGDFDYFNGQPVPPIIRINGNEEFSIEEPKVSKLQLYPNPVNDKLTVSTDRIIDKIEIYNVSGQLVKTIISNKKQESIDVSGLQPGYYFLKLESKGDIISKKFIVIH